MKKLFALFICCFSALVLQAQENSSEFPKFNEGIKGLSVLKFITYMPAESMIPTYDLKDLSDDELVSSLFKKEFKHWDIFNAHKSEFLDILRDYGYFGKISNYVNAIDFWSLADSQTCVFVGGYMYDKKFNTLRTTDKERATDMATTIIMPTAYKVAPKIKALGYKYFAVAAAYAMRDFSEKYGPDDGGVVTAIIPIEIIDKVSDLELTEEEALHLIDVYQEEESILKKIKL